MANETYQTMVDNLRLRLDEVGVEGFWTDAELLRYLNEGARDISRKAECNRASADVDWVANTDNATIVADAVRVHRFEWQTDNDTRRIPLEIRDFETMDQIWYTNRTIRTGEPRFVATWGYPPNLKAHLYPVPSSDGTLRVYYYALSPITTTATDNVDLPAGWETVLLDHGCYKAMMKDRDDRWQTYKQLYDENLTSLINASDKFNDSAGMIATATGFDVPQWLYDPSWIG